MQKGKKRTRVAGVELGRLSFSPGGIWSSLASNVEREHDSVGIGRSVT